MILARDLSPVSLAASPMDPASSDWARVAETDAEGRFFAGPEFSAAYGAEFGTRAETFALGLASDDGVLRAVMPAMTCRVLRSPGLSARFDYLRGDGVHLSRPPRAFVPLRQIAPQIGLEAASLRAHIVAEPGWHERAWAAIPAALAMRAGWDVAILPVPEDRLMTLSAGASARGLIPLLRPIGREVQSLEQLPPLADILARGSTKFAQNIRRAERFAAEAGADFDLVEGRAVAAAMSEFAALAGQSWKRPESSPGGEAQAVVVPYEGAQRRFCETLVRSPGGVRPLMTRVHQGGSLRAACLGFLAAGTLTTFALFQTTDTGRESYGRLVLHRMFEAGREQGAHRVDLNATGQWTRLYADRIQRVENLLLFRPTLYGRMLHALARTAGGWSTA